MIALHGKVNSSKPFAPGGSKRPAHRDVDGLLAQARQSFDGAKRDVHRVILIVRRTLAVGHVLSTISRFSPRCSPLAAPRSELERELRSALAGCLAPESFRAGSHHLIR